MSFNWDLERRFDPFAAGSDPTDAQILALRGGGFLVAASTGSGTTLQSFNDQDAVTGSTSLAAGSAVRLAELSDGHVAIATGGAGGPQLTILDASGTSAPLGHFFFADPTDHTTHFSVAGTGNNGEVLVAFSDSATGATLAKVFDQSGTLLDSTFLFGAGDTGGAPELAVLPDGDIVAAQVTGNGVIVTVFHPTDTNHPLTTMSETARFFAVPPGSSVSTTSVTPLADGTFLVGVQAPGALSSQVKLFDASGNLLDGHAFTGTDPHGALLDNGDVAFIFSTDPNGGSAIASHVDQYHLTVQGAGETTQFVSFGELFVPTNFIGPFAAISDDTLVMAGNPINRQAYLTKFSLGGELYEQATNFPRANGFATGIFDQRLQGDGHGNFYLIGQLVGSSGPGFDKLDSDFNILVPNTPILTEAAAQADSSVWSLTDVYALANGGVGFATTDSINSQTSISGLPGNPGTALEGLDVRAKLYDAAGNSLGDDFLVSNTGAGLAGTQQHVRGTQLSNGNVAFVFADTFYTSNPNDGSTESTDATSVSVYSANGQQVAFNQFVHNTDGTGIIQGGQPAIAAFGTGFVAVNVVTHPFVPGPGPGSYHLYLDITTFDANGGITSQKELPAPFYVDPEGQAPVYVRATADGGFVAEALIADQYGTDPARIGLLKFDAQGNHVGTDLFDDPFGATVGLNVNDMQVAPDGEILLTISDAEGHSGIFSYIAAGAHDSVQTILSGTGQTLTGAATTGGQDWLHGGIGADTLIGSDQVSHLFGGEGADTLRGNGGNDLIDGGAGIDTAEYAGPRSAYSVITAIGTDGVVHTTVTETAVTAGVSDGTDTLTSVEKLHFADVTVTVGSNNISDMDGDGVNDLVFQSHSTVDTLYASMPASTLVDDIFPALTGVDATQIRAAGTGDVDGNGTADVVFQIGDDIVTKAAGDITTTFGPMVFAVPDGWTVSGVGDVNGDGAADIVITDATNDAGKGDTFFIDAKASFATLHTATPHEVASNLATPGATYVVRGVGDINGDGVNDVVFQSTIDGDVIYADMAGVTQHVAANNFSLNDTLHQILSPSVINASLVVKAVGDLDGDGLADLVVEQESDPNAGPVHSLVLEAHNGGSNTFAFQTTGSITDYAAFDVKAIADVTGDGIGDILMQYTQDLAFGGANLHGAVIVVDPAHGSTAASIALVNQTLSFGDYVLV